MEVIMSPHLEFEDKTVEKAVGKACEELNIPREKLKYDVISYGSTGIFGLVGIKKARIRVTHLPPGKTADTSYQNGQTAEAPGSEPITEQQTSVSQPFVKDGQAPEQMTERSRRTERSRMTERSRRAERSRKAERNRRAVSEDIEDQEEDDADDDADDDDDFYDDEEDIEDDLIPPEEDEAEADSLPLPEEHEDGDGEREITEAEAVYLDLGKNALQRIVDFITADATVSLKIHSERITFQIQGGNTAVLIGKRGQTLEAIQYLVEKIVNKNHPQRIRIQVDIEGYLDSRRARLESLAARLSEKAKRIGKPITIGQLNAHDRRIVHIALKDDTGVRTQSMGEGFYRKLVIFPQKSRSRKRTETEE